MCGYSLEQEVSRDACSGDHLVATTLGGHGTVAFVTLDEPNLPVCLLPGTTVVVTDVPESLRAEYRISNGDRATFIERTEGPYRDALAFDCHVPGKSVLLQDLAEGFCLDVVIVPATKAIEEEIHRELEAA